MSRRWSRSPLWFKIGALFLLGYILLAIFLFEEGKPWSIIAADALFFWLLPTAVAFLTTTFLPEGWLPISLTMLGWTLIWTLRAAIYGQAWPVVLLALGAIWLVITILALILSRAR